MTSEFQVIYGVENGLVQTLNAVAEAPDQLVAQFVAAGFRVVGVNKVRPMIDWEQPNFDRDEAAAFLRMKSDTLSLHKGSGRVPWSKVGAGIYPRRLLEKYVMENANPAAKELHGHD